MASPVAMAKKQAAETARLAEAVINTAESTAEVVAILEKINKRLAYIEQLVAPAEEEVSEPTAKATRTRSK